jgi:predicted DNA-binding WGR domain protein
VRTREIPRLWVFERIRPEENERRRYVIATARTLFGTWGVLLAWGRLDTSQWRQRILEFETPEEAIQEAEAQVERRHKRGYRLVFEA